MRIVIDMQGAQTESRFRGMGRYSLSIAQAIARNCGEHNVILALNGLFADTIEPIRAAFNKLLPSSSIYVWYSPGPIREVDPRNALRRDIAEHVREAFIKALRPDVLLITSLFEGLGDDAVTSVGRFDADTPTAVILYDLIPLISPDHGFRTNPIYINYYSRKIESLKLCASLLAISESSRREALDALDFNKERVTNISSGCDPRFGRIDTTDAERQALFRKLGITKPFLMYTGGADARKNLDRLIEAFALLPDELRGQYQLVLVGKMPEGNVSNYRTVMTQNGLHVEAVIFTGYVHDLELMQLYSLCELFVFPSLHEGFGLPPLEAMACGAPVITANVTSLPEVMGRDDAMFDPLSATAISAKIKQVLTDPVFRKELIRYGSQRVKTFSWDQCAKTAIGALEQIAKPSRVRDPDALVRTLETGLFKPIYKRILVSKLDHMGDLVLAIPTIMKLRARYPHALIDAMVGSWNVEAAQLLGVFDTIHVLDFFAKKSAISPEVFESTLLSTIGHLDRYDLAIDLRRQRDTRFILLKVPSELYVGYATGDLRMDSRLNVCLPTFPDEPFKTTLLNRTPTSLQMLALVNALPDDVNDYIRLPKLVASKADRRGRVALFPKAGNDVKEWGDQNFLKLIHLLGNDPDITTISIYTSTSLEATQYRSACNTKVEILSGLAYSDLIESVSSQTVCVANNSFGAHIAAILGVGVIGVYAGHETVAEWAPVFGDSKAIFVPVGCSPCHIAQREDCKLNFKCMLNITPEYVFKEVMFTLGGGGLRVSQSARDINCDLDKAIALKSTNLVALDQHNLCLSIHRNFDLNKNEPNSFDVNPAQFRREYGVAEEYMLFISDVGESADYTELLDFFIRYKAAQIDPLKLVLIGKIGVLALNHPDIRVIDYCSDNTKSDAIAACSVLVVASHNECYSSAVLEAWSMGKPVIVNAKSKILTDLCRKAGGGLWYENFDEFALGVTNLRNDHISSTVGRQGWRYLEQNNKPYSTI